MHIIFLCKTGQNWYLKLLETSSRSPLAVSLCFFWSINIKSSEADWRSALYCKKELPPDWLSLSRGGGACRSIMNFCQWIVFSHFTRFSCSETQHCMDSSYTATKQEGNKSLWLCLQSMSFELKNTSSGGPALSVTAMFAQRHKNRKVRGRLLKLLRLPKDQYVICRSYIHLCLYTTTLQYFTLNSCLPLVWFSTTNHFLNCVLNWSWTLQLETWVTAPIV